MNEVLRGQLAAPGWMIPEYARDSLWLDSLTGGMRADGEYGLFTLDVPSAYLTVHWRDGDGPVLAQLPWRSETLGWDGGVSIGGYIDAMHVTEVSGVGMPIVVFYMGGQPLKYDFTPYITGPARLQSLHPRPDFYDGLASDVPESVTTWLVGEDSPLAGIAQDALLNNLRLYCFGHLASDESQWGEFFALPILMEAVTLFAP